MPSDRAGAPICGIILAAGGSARMGRSKQQLPLRGKPLLQHAIDVATGTRFAEIIVVLGDHAGEVAAALSLPKHTRTVVNADHAQGLASSLRCGLRAASADARAAAILLGDEPAIAAASIDVVIAAWRASGALIARAVYTDRPGARTPGHPVVVDRALWPLTDDLRGDEGLRSIMQAHREWVLDVQLSGPPPADIDTPGDYRAAGGDAPVGAC